MAFLEKLISLAKEEKGLLAVDQSVKQVGPYEQVAVLGAGTYGLVIKAVDSTNPQQSPVAIKLLPRGAFVKEYRRYVLREILHHGNLKHPFIIQLREVFTTPQYLAIVMDYAQGGNLQRFLADRCPGQRLSEQQSRWLFQQLIIGLDFCHKMGVANRDLKLDNLLLVRDPQSGNPLLRICDFGYSKHDRSSTLQTQVGTPVYMAPEVVLMSRDYDTKKADVWSCGIILYAMMFGYYPFNPKDPRLPARMMEGNLVYPSEVSTSEECRSLIAGMLRPNPQQRMGVDQVLEHPWFLADLPEGALTMNSWYLEHVAPLEDRVELVQSIVDAAAAPGREGEPGLGCAF